MRCIYNVFVLDILLTGICETRVFSITVKISESRQIMLTIDGLVMWCVYTFMQMFCRAAPSYWDGLHDLNYTLYTHMHAYLNAETQCET